MPNFDWKGFITELKRREHWSVRPVDVPKRTGGEFWRHAFGLKKPKERPVTTVTPDKTTQPHSVPRPDVKGKGFVMKHDTTLTSTPTTKHQFRPA